MKSATSSARVCVWAACKEETKGRDVLLPKLSIKLASATFPRAVPKPSRFVAKLNEPTHSRLLAGCCSKAVIKSLLNTCRHRHKREKGM